MNLYAKYVEKMHRIADIQHAVAVLHWDKEVNLPAGATQFRAQQIATLSSMAHAMFTEEATAQLLERLDTAGNLDPDQVRNVELSLRDYRKEVQLPTEFVGRLSLAQAESFTAWIRAREANDFTLFAPALTQIVALKQEEAELRGYARERYDALLDVYEHGLTAGTLDALFSDARTRLIPMIGQITAAGQTDPGFLRGYFPRELQWEFGLQVMKELGYRFDHGRQDISAHPFTISFSPQDVRVTTRIDEHDFSNMFWSCLHECGHAMYEQGLSTEQYGLPLGSPASLAIHESQSRLWENQVGRSQAFWRFQLPRLKRIFPSQLGDIAPDQFYGAVNHIAPNYIRTEADELHYHLHVIIRYEIERELVNHGIAIDTLPETWNRKYKEYLGVEVPDDNRGILQDVHWSHGSFGYFPTYSLGSFYAAQFYRQAEADLPDLESHLGEGVYTGLHDWLKDRVYRHGRRYDPEALCREITSAPLDISHFADYVRNKYGLADHGAKINRDP